MSKEILSCPFCGGKPSLHFGYDDSTKSKYVFVSCEDCEAIGPQVFYAPDPVYDGDEESAREKAIAFWNARK